tara:strand:+ start:735 stop:1142 length:408 start_codon:yes stop_codon:yes gene_type:complete
MEFTKQDTFSDRLIIFLFHFAFFLNIFKASSAKKKLQVLFDSVFKQLELSLREYGFGDVTINKKMKTYVNIFYAILEKVDNWKDLSKKEKNLIFSEYLNLNNENVLLASYFDKYIDYLKNNTLNSLLKGVIKLKF